MVYHRARKYKLVQITVGMKNVPGAIAEVTDRLAKVGLNLLEGSFSDSEGAKGGFLSFFAELRSPTLTPRRLKAALADSKAVVSVEVKEGREGAIIDTVNFPVTWGTGDRVLMLRTAFFGEMSKVIRELFASGADPFLYELGFAHGNPTWDDLLKTLKVKDAKSLNYALQIYSAVGWCRLKVLDYDQGLGTARLRMDDSFECATAPKGSPGSHLLRGHVAGAMSAVLHIPVRCLETRCIAKGHRFCELQVVPITAPPKIGV